jgi:hypothetical protein
VKIASTIKGRERKEYFVVKAMPRLLGLASVPAIVIFVLLVAPANAGQARLAAPAPSTAHTPAVTSLTVRSTWGWPQAKTTGGQIPLVGGDCGGFTSGTVGYLTAPTGGSTMVTGKCSGQSGAQVIVLTFHGLGHTGTTFTGKITIGTTQVSLSVQRASVIWLPILALLFGLLIALYLLHMSPMRIISALRARLRLALAAIGTTDSPGNAVTAFRQAAAGQPWANLDVSADAQSLGDQLDKDLTKLRSSKWFSLSAKDPQVTSMTKRVTVLEAVPGELTTLATSLSALTLSVPAADASGLVPAWVTAVRSDLASTGPITVEDLSALVKRTSEASKYAQGFPVIATRIASYQGRMKDLRTFISQDAHASQAQQVSDADGLLQTALAALHDASTTDDVNAAYTQQFSAAKAAIDKLGDVQAGHPATFTEMTFLNAAALPLSRPEQLPSLPPALQRQAASIIDKDLGASVIGLALTFGLLLYAGLEALVIGKTFGTSWNFLAAIAWGAAAVAVGSPLASTIEGIQQARQISRS